MTTFQRSFTALIVFELIACAAAVGWRVSRPVSPPVDVRRLDDETRSLIDSLVLRTWDGSVTAWNRLAHAYLGNGFFPQAEACYRRILADDPQNITALYGLGLCLSRTGRTTEAIEQFQQFVTAAGPQHADAAWYQIGRCQLREEHADAAEFAFQQVTRMQEAMIQWAQLLVRSGRADEAQRVIDGLLTQNPRALHVLELAMHSAQQRNRPRDAARYAAQLESSAHMFAMSLDVSDIENYRRLAASGGTGSAPEQAPRNDSPAEAYQRLARKLAQSRDGRDRRLLLPTAQAALEAGHTLEAIDLLDRQFKHSQITPQALITFGDAMLAMQNPDAAVRVWQRSLRLRPTAEACRRLADQDLEVVDDTQRRDYSALASHLAGVREFRAHRAQAALDELKKAVELKPDHAPSWLYMGKTLLLLQRTSEATDAFQKCLDLDPDNSDAMAAVAMRIADGISGE